MLSNIGESYVKVLTGGDYFYTDPHDGGAKVLSLTEKQKEIVGSFCDNKTTIVVKGRQVGGTTLILTTLIETCKKNPNTHVLIEGIDRNNENEMINKLKKLIDLHVLKTNNNTLISAYGASSVTFNNGSVISRYIEDNKVDIIYASELAHFDDEPYKSLKKTFDKYSPAKVIVESTPSTKNDRFKDFVEKNENSEGKGIIYINILDVNTVKDPQQVCEYHKKTLSKDAYEKEILGKL